MLGHLFHYAARAWLPHSLPQACLPAPAAVKRGDEADKVGEGTAEEEVNGGVDTSGDGAGDEDEDDVDEEELAERKSLKALVQALDKKELANGDSQVGRRGGSDTSCRASLNRI